MCVVIDVFGKNNSKEPGETGKLTKFIYAHSSVGTNYSLRKSPDVRKTLILILLTNV